MQKPELPPNATPIMNVLDAIAVRRSVHRYKPDSLSPELIRTLLDAASQAASSWSLEPWEFVVVTTKEAKEKLCAAIDPLNRPQVMAAPVTFVCLGSMRRHDQLADILEKAWFKPGATEERIEWAEYYMKRIREDEHYRREHVLGSAFIGITQLVLAAQGLGLGTVFMGGYNEQAVKQAMGVPDDYLLACLVSVGWPVEELKPEPRERRPLEDIYWFETFGGHK